MAGISVNYDLVCWVIPADFGFGNYDCKQRVTVEGFVDSWWFLLLLSVARAPSLQPPLGYLQYPTLDSYMKCAPREQNIAIVHGMKLIKRISPDLWCKDTYVGVAVLPTCAHCCRSLPLV